MSKRIIEGNNLESESFQQWLLHSSNHFTTKTSRTFLKLTRLPPDFLRICVEYRYRNSQTHFKSKNRNGLSSLPTKDLHKILQFRQQKLELLFWIQHELARENREIRHFYKELPVFKRTLKVLRTIERTVGWEPWMAFIDHQQTCDGAGVCPKCRNIFFKDGGCCSMSCHCGHQFSFQDAKLDMTLLELGNEASRVHSEHLFRRRLLKSAEDLLLMPMDSHKKTKPRPSLNNEDVFQIPSHRGCSYRSFASLPCVREEEEEKTGEAIFESQEPTRNPSGDELDQETSNYSSQIEDDEFSFSLLTTASCAPSDTVSLCDYIYVSDAKDADDLSLSSVPVLKENRDEEDSYSLLSGCNTVYSLDNDDYQPINTIGDKSDMILSYCMATKLGNSRSKHAEEISFKAKEHKDESSSDTMAYERNFPKKGNHDKESDTCGTNSYLDQDEDDDDLFLSIYDAAKSSHGGRVASRFKGNPRISRTSSDWEIHRRPNWSRKRRKKWKQSRLRYW